MPPPARSHRFAALAVVGLLGVAGCGGDNVFCSADLEKASVGSRVADWYLYQDLLPAGVNARDYADAAAYLDALTAQARAQGKDRSWSYLMSKAQYDAYFQRAQSAGFGFRFLLEGQPPTQRLLLADVYAKAPAGQAGFVRGDEILALGASAGALAPVATTSVADLDALLAVPASTTRFFQVKPAGGGPTVVRSATAAAAFDLEPVPSHQIFHDPAGDVGYVALRSFVQPADDLLRAAFADFKAAGVRSVVVDLRYNGGGYIETAQVLASLLAADLGAQSQPMFSYTYNVKHGAAGPLPFSVEANAGAFDRIAFVTTSQSASASELVPNVLDPYKAIAFAGARTYGKPVGQVIFDLGACDEVLFLISFKLTNAAGHADYFAGLPDASSRGPLCAAADDLSQAMDSPSEASTAAAVTFARTGACPTASAAASAALSLRRTRTPLLARHPSVGQRELPGLY